MTTHDKLAGMVAMLHKAPQTVDTLSATLEYHTDGIRRFLRSLSALGLVKPQGSKEQGMRGSKPLLWVWVK